jgi:hypothetical protein
VADVVGGTGAAGVTGTAAAVAQLEQDEEDKGNPFMERRGHARSRISAFPCRKDRNA